MGNDPTRSSTNAECYDPGDSALRLAKRNDCFCVDSESLKDVGDGAYVDPSTKDIFVYVVP